VLNLQNAARVRGLGTLFIGGSDGGAYTVQGETNNSGSLGTNELGIVIRSGGLIDANVSGLALVVDPGDAGDLFNFGVMRASAGGILRLTGSGNGIFDNGGGTIAALDGSEVQLTAGAFITGGTLTTVGTGTIRNIGSATLDSVTNSGNFIANNGSTTTFSGNITNTGNLLLGSTGSFTDLFINSNVTLLGGSTLTLQNAARVRGIGTLFNGGPGGEPFTIQGETNNSGSLGTNELAIVNRSGGIINANVSGLQLIVDPRATDGLINNGIMQASNGGILTLTGSGGGGFDNTGGIIRAIDGSEVRLTQGAVITGGTLFTPTVASAIRNLSTATLASLTNNANFIANNASTTTLMGSIETSAGCESTRLAASPICR
jgi:hypothetical protein